MASVSVLELGGSSAEDALEGAPGEILVFTAPGDRLRPGAVDKLAAALDRADLAYGDEVHGATVVRKPGWSPHLLLSYDFVGHPWAVRKHRALAVGGVRSVPAAELDLVLRIAEAGGRGERIAETLSQREAPAAIDGEAQRRCVEEACRRRGISARVEMGGAPGLVRVIPEIAGEGISVVVPTRDRVDLLRVCVDGLERETDYRAIEILIADNDSRDRDTLDYLSRSPHRVIRCPGEFDYAAIHNRVVREAVGPLVLLLNNDVQVIERGWLRALAERMAFPEVGAVGGWLLYPDGRIQHAGAILRRDHPVHLLRGAREAELRHPWFGRAPCEVSAVTGACLLTRKRLFVELGGFDPRFRIGFNDLDYCLRLRGLGFSTVIEPRARLVHHESASREIVFPLAETVLFRARWNHRFPDGDPYYHPALDRERADFSEATRE